MADTSAEAGSVGLFGSLRNLGRTLVTLLHTRLELLSTEVEEQGLRLQHMLLLALATGFCLAVAALLAVTFFVVLFWETHRLAAIAVLFVLFAAAGAGFGLALRASARSRPRVFAATLEEIARDRDALGGGGP